MTRMFGYFANQTDRLRCALALDGPALAFGPGGRIDGWGLGSYQGSELLLRKRPSEQREAVQLADLVRELRTSCVVAHARIATVGPRTLDNTHPFRHRAWLFAHTGTLPRFAEMRAALRAQVPEHLARGIRGDTDSEVLFHLFLGAVYRLGRLDDPDFDRAGITDALLEAVGMVDATCGPGATLNLVVTNGHAMVALQRGAPMSWMLRRGIRDCPVCRKAPETPGREARRVDHESLRYVMLAGDRAVEASGWQPVPDAPRGSVVAIDKHLDVRVTAL